jgi:hypothetical protein
MDKQYKKTLTLHLPGCPNPASQGQPVLLLMFVILYFFKKHQNREDHVTF